MDVFRDFFGQCFQFFGELDTGGIDGGMYVGQMTLMHSICSGGALYLERIASTVFAFS